MGTRKKRRIKIRSWNPSIEADAIQLHEAMLNIARDRLNGRDKIYQQQIKFLKDKLKKTDEELNQRTTQLHNLMVKYAALKHKERAWLLASGLPPPPRPDIEGIRRRYLERTARDRTGSR